MQQTYCRRCCIVRVCNLSEPLEGLVESATDDVLLLNYVPGAGDYQDDDEVEPKGPYAYQDL